MSKKEDRLTLTQQAALIAAEEFALSMVPLLLAVNEVGGVTAAILILRAKKKANDEKERG